MYIYIHTHTHKNTSTLQQTYTLTCTHTRIRPLEGCQLNLWRLWAFVRGMCVPVCVYISRMHLYIHTCTHTHTQTQIRLNKQTHAHAHTQGFVLLKGDNLISNSSKLFRINVQIYKESRERENVRQREREMSPRSFCWRYSYVGHDVWYVGHVA